MFDPELLLLLLKLDKDERTSRWTLPPDKDKLLDEEEADSGPSDN